MPYLYAVVLAVLAGLLYRVWGLLLTERAETARLKARVTELSETIYLDQLAAGTGGIAHGCQ